MKVRMLQTTKGAEDGINVVLYKEGLEYEMRDGLAKSLIAAKLAVEATLMTTEVPRPDLEKIVRGVVEEVRPAEVATEEDVEPEEPITTRFRKSKRTR